MTSIQSIPKQVSINNGYFRVVPALLASTNSVGVPIPVSSYMYSLVAGALTPFIPQSANVQFQLSSGQALLKDMGVNFLSASTVGNSQLQIFRRVQVVVSGVAAPAGVAGSEGAETNGVGGSITGVDSDYNCAYIAMGFNGAFVSPGLGPFIRTG